jgi:hypothetical protein
MILSVTLFDNEYPYSRSFSIGSAGASNKSAWMARSLNAADLVGAPGFFAGAIGKSFLVSVN